jgi:hypothetical protein
MWRKMMPEYRVKWEIDIIASNPQEAAYEALSYTNNERAQVFEVTEDGKKPITVDLAEVRESKHDWTHEVQYGNTVLGFYEWLDHYYESQQGDLK